MLRRWRFAGQHLPGGEREQRIAIGFGQHTVDLTGRCVRKEP